MRARPKLNMKKACHAAENCYCCGRAARDSQKKNHTMRQNERERERHTSAKQKKKLNTNSEKSKSKRERKIERQKNSTHSKIRAR